MISRSILRNLPLRNAVAHSANTSHLFYHRPLPVTQCKITIWSYPSFKLPPSRGYHQPRQKYYRFDPNEVQNARPLFSDEHIRNLSKHSVLRVFIALLGAGVVVYIINIEDVPVSGRRRFNIYSHKDMEREGQMMYQQILRQCSGAILPEWDDRTQMVQRVMNRLIPASGIDNVNWEVNVIDSTAMNAFVIPGGKVFVLTGILSIAKTDDDLATILGHEIAHNIANHSGERMSKNVVFYMPLRILFRFFDATGYTGGLGQILGAFALEFGMNLPASRNQETEADHIGLMIMAKSCYDPQAALGVWERLQAAERNAPPQWLSTHPSNGSRIKQLQEWMSKAEAARADSGCAPTTNNFNDFRKAFGGRHWQ